MDTDIIAQTMRAWTDGRDARRARIALFEHVRDIPYRYPASREPSAVLANGYGSCSGKHYLLGEMYRRLGLDVRHVICTHRFNESLIVFPGPMQEMLRKNEIVDMHDSLQISAGGVWVDVDATWPCALREFGFPVNEEWDGERAMLLSVVPEDLTIAERDPEAMKDELLSKLPPRQRGLRTQFLTALNDWVQELGAELQRDGGGA